MRRALGTELRRPERSAQSQSHQGACSTIPFVEHSRNEDTVENQGQSVVARARREVGCGYKRQQACDATVLRVTLPHLINYAACGHRGPVPRNRRKARGRYQGSLPGWGVVLVGEVSRKVMIVLCVCHRCTEASSTETRGSLDGTLGAEVSGSWAEPSSARRRARPPPASPRSLERRFLFAILPTTP